MNEKVFSNPNNGKMDLKPHLSILMMAYNQGDYIQEAIESVLKQVLPFEWELVIGDDASTDNTEEVVLEFVAKYPLNIRYFKHEKNIGLHLNYIFSVAQCKGKYIALLEADDYWIDIDKSKRQVNFMDENPNVVWTFTDGILVNEKNEIIQKIQFDKPEIFNFEFFLGHFFNPLNNTIVFRKTAEPINYPLFFNSVAQWDTVLHYLRSLKGDIGYIALNGLAWRRHAQATSFSSGFSGVKRYKDWIKINKHIKQYIPDNLHTYFSANFIAYEFISLAYFRERKYLLFLKYFFLMIFNKPFRAFAAYRDYFWKLRKQ